MIDYLNNFHKRMEKLSYSYLIDSKAATLSFYKEYFNDIEFINLIYTLMVFILEKSLKDEECTLDDMTCFLYDIINKFYHQQFSEEETKSLTYEIVYRILRNDGKPFFFETIDYLTGRRFQYQYHLLQQKNSQFDENKSTFYLEKEGYRLILNSLEVDEKLQIDLNQMILELSLKKKNFSEGVMAAQNLHKLITAQIQVIKQFILRIRESIFLVTSEDFEKHYLQNINVLKEQNDKFYELYDLVIKEEERVKVMEATRLKKYESLQQLDYIKELLTNITEKASALIGYHFQFKEEYEEALELFSSYYQNKRLSVKDHILKPIEEDGSKLGAIYPFFNALFQKKVPKIFNLNFIFKSQELIGENVEDMIISIFDVDINNPKVIKMKEDFDKYQKMIYLMLGFIIHKQETSLKELITSYENHPLYETLVPSVRKLGEVLIELLRLGEINIREIITSENDKYHNDELDLDIKKVLVNYFTSNSSPYDTLSFIKGDNTMEIRDKQKAKVVMILKCPNILMNVK